MPSSEPVIYGFSVTALLAIVLNLVAAFGWWTPSAQQLAAITPAVIALVSVVAAIVVRARVTPTTTVQQLVATNGRSDPE